MGNAYALKIKKIDDMNILKDIIFGQDYKIVDYLYYITKINKYYVENFRKGTIISEFTILDILTRKEYNIVIERVEAGYFFDGLHYSLEEIPQKIDTVLFISTVIEGSTSYIHGVTAGNMILLGNEQKYFRSFADIENEIVNKNARFIFYDFENKKIVEVDFEKFRSEEGELKMGFECQERGLDEVLKGDIKVKEENHQNKIQTIENVEKVNGLNITANDANNKDQDHINNSNNNGSIEEKGVAPSDEIEVNMSENIDGPDNSILIEPVNDKIDIKIDTNPNEDASQDQGEKLEKLNHITVNGSSAIDNTISITSNININKSNCKYKFESVKKKYTKYLSIYDKIDSNFNFMNISKKVEPIVGINTTSREESMNEEKSIKKTKGMIEDNFNEEENPIVTKENKISSSPSDPPNLLQKKKKTILIKGYFLTKVSDFDYNCLRISNLDQNTQP